MSRKTAGKCETCSVVWQWEGALRLREAKCPRCNEPLARTAVSLIKDKSTIKRAEPASGRTLREVKTCCKCHRPIPRPLLPVNEDERCSACADPEPEVSLAGGGDEGVAHARPESFTVGAEEDGWVPIRDENGLTAARVCVDVDGCVNFDLAHVMAAAPELLAVLSDAVEEAPRGCPFLARAEALVDLLRQPRVRCEACSGAGCAECSGCGTVAGGSSVHSRRREAPGS